MLFELVSTVIFVFSEFVKGDYFRERTNFTIVHSADLFWLCSFHSHMAASKLKVGFYYLMH